MAACDNRLTVRATVVDTHLLAGLRGELLRPDTARYVVAELTRALNRLVDERPRQERDIRTARDQAAQRLQRLIAAIESGVDPHTLALAIGERQAEIARLDAQLFDFAEPLHERLAVIPRWVDRQLGDLERLLTASVEQTKLEFQRLQLQVVMQPMRTEGTPPFYRATGQAALPCLAAMADLTGQTGDRSLQ